MHGWEEKEKKEERRKEGTVDLIEICYFFKARSVIWISLCPKKKTNEK